MKRGNVIKSLRGAEHSFVIDMLVVVVGMKQRD